MYKNIILVVILITTFIFPVQGSIINLPYTESINIVNYTITDITYINIPSGNIIDSIMYKPIFLVGVTGTYIINNTYYCNDNIYIDEFESVTSTSIFHFFTKKYTYDISHTIDYELSYQKEYETYVSQYCWFPIKITQYFGSLASENEKKISVESEIFGHTGIKRTSDIFNIYNSQAYSSTNYTIQHEGFSDLDIIISYKIEGLHTTDYYIGQLSPTLKNLYKLGFAWIDKELYILNLFLITDKLINIIMFCFSVIAKSFIPLIIILSVFIIPLFAYINSKGRKKFISNLIVYYGIFFNIVLSFVRYIVMMIMRVLEIVRSLIPFV